MIILSYYTLSVWNLKNYHLFCIYISFHMVLVLYSLVKANVPCVIIFKWNVSGYLNNLHKNAKECQESYPSLSNSRKISYFGQHVCSAQQYLTFIINDLFMVYRFQILRHIWYTYHCHRLLKTNLFTGLEMGVINWKQQQYFLPVAWL